MAVQLNHTILYARDSKASAKFLTEILGLPAPAHWGPFEVVATENGANLDYLDTADEIASQHYAFLVGEDEFETIAHDESTQEQHGEGSIEGDRDQEPLLRVVGE